jgi:NAD(P)-dependent dehydrogenase (short-subunit alcohol dehydrogenase family)
MANARFSLEGKTALITGGSRGIGYAIAEAFIDAGARVIITARGEEKLMAAANRLGPNAIGKRCDNANPADIARLVEESWRLGPIQILVNNAGISPYYKRVEHVTVDEWDSVADVNMRGTYFASVEVATRLFEAGLPGSIVNISSMAGDVPLERQGVYGATKAGVHQMARVMALEWADRNVRVNCVAPGWVQTELVDELFASRHGERLLSDIPMGRLATGDDVVGAALYLASDASRYVTGTVLPVDGGRALR